MKILILCTYPIEDPRHGGQLRVRNIVDNYRAAGHIVQVCGVLGSSDYASEKGFLPFPSGDAFSKIIKNSFLMEDYAIGEIAANDISFYEKLTSLIEIVPDVIQVEHPWFFRFAKKYVQSKSIKSKIIYSSHNIEFDLKYQILSNYFDEKQAIENSNLIEKIELLAIREADAIFCVSENDANRLRLETDCPVILAPNGVKAWEIGAKGKKEALDISGDYAYALYCASAHPPNVTGFFNIFGNGFGSLKPDEKLVVAGGAGYSIVDDMRIHTSSKLAEKVVVAGVVNQSCLEGLINGAHCIVLPITQGGGTNLKTAEALWAQKHIVATNTAMRGFENFVGTPGVHVADSSEVFKRTLRAVMEAPPLQLSVKEIEARQSLLWRNCLAPLNNYIHSLQKGREI